ncbi:MAG: ATP-binding cassette domain-containing protein [Halothiobacillus sp.]|jgi:iron(III) transport system ATP-binding protein|uniref:ABC transporter ATP-binding protein n=1 Tax=Halothiobacillus sp. TaxID=1891311 RepID=UPI002AD46B9B|nr:ATP-binding cassette domain-containing protein [Halothiobacillus sp.]MDA3875944.1 ATP-binding cassette domain-containing protein [Halothiobacillus sp.]
MTTHQAADFLCLSGIGKTFHGTPAVRDIDLTITAGESVCFLGPSGCGKTTLLRLIAGLETPDVGQISLNGVDITGVPPRARHFGMVFQSYSLFPHLTVGKNVAYGLRCRKWNTADTRRRVQEMLDLVQLADHIDKLPNQLSGGQQQRVALARALAAQPHVLLLDEPFSALDAKVRGQLRADVRELQSRLGITTILVTHDQEEAMAVADRIVVMNGGRIEQIGSGPEIYHAPDTAFVGRFVGDMNVLQVRGNAEGRLMLAGKSLAVNEAVRPCCDRVGIRPEAIQLVQDAIGPNHFQVAVLKTQFLGKQTRLDLLLDGQPIQVDVYGQRDITFAPGDLIPVFLPPNEIRPLNEH